MLKRLLIVTITCVVVDQLKSHVGWLTHCRGIEVDGEVVFEERIQKGQAVEYKPYIVDGDDYIHGAVVSIHDAPKEPERVKESSETGKVPQ